MTERVMYEDFKEQLAQVGLVNPDIDRIRLTVATAASQARPLELEVTVICRDDDGEIYTDAETGEMVREVHRFPLAALRFTRRPTPEPLCVNCSKQLS